MGSPLNGGGGQNKQGKEADCAEGADQADFVAAVEQLRGMLGKAIVGDRLHLRKNRSNPIHCDPALAAQDNGQGRAGTV